MSEREKEIRGAVERLPEAVAKDALAMALARGGENTAASVDQRAMEHERFTDIFELVAYLKRTYRFPELGRLLLEGGKLLFRDGDRRIVMAERRIGGEAARPTPSAPSAPAAGGSGGKQGGGSAPPAGGGEGGQQPERFRRLELDE
ncbi:hypothetical protein [Sediminispirochaeta bajacaliforniensis]|uniref:hypothetical protein n=1 Tax=Sediminispirochaeta bajacaliforniensis TaxID=148 RepID=UPI00036781A1|nr:hypothetical protein [Sediminispirochaeta bajacaliforniensis]